MNPLIVPVKEIARLAGEIIRHIYENTTAIHYQRKDDDSPLTLADRAANAFIVQELNKLDPKYPVISEESTLPPYEERKKYDTFWMVDPLDGTKEFIKRNGEFTVNIALIEKRRPILGVVYAPMLDEMYWAVKGEDAFVNKGGEVKRLTAKRFSLDQEKLRVVCSRSHLNNATQKELDSLANPILKEVGSSLKFMLLASGEADYYPRMSPTMEWDIAASQIILEEAGGSIISEYTKQAVVYNKENLRNPHFKAYGRRI